MSRTHVLRALGASTFFAGALMINSAVAAPAAPVATVKIANFTFQAPVVTVKPGSTVTWVNDDDIPHTVTANDKSFKSKVLDSGDKFSFTFAKPGEFGYFCSLHPHMTGKVIVRA
jgi:amicyanin